MAMIASTLHTPLSDLNPKISGSFSGQSDNELLEQIKARSELALGILMDRHQSLLRSVIGRVVGNTPDIDELIQDVFLFVWHHPESYSSDRGRFSSWLATIARNRAVDRLRKLTAYDRAMERFEIKGRHHSFIFDPVGVALRKVQQNELTLLLGDQLRALPPRQSEAVTLAFYQGFSQREISARLGVPLSTVKTRIKLGLQRLNKNSTCSLDAWHADARPLEKCGRQTPAFQR
jgi:RNA polymerase sigma-70 factor (ECF subfamily)